MNTHAILFDLDNTLYPATSGLMGAIDTRILDYLRNRLGITQDEAIAIRRDYFSTYGTTLRGLQLHGQIDAEDYLTYVHDLAFESLLQSDAELDHLLGQLRIPKAIFTNSPAEHARNVLRTLGIERHFDHIFDIRFQEFLPKPDENGYLRALSALGVTAQQTIMVEDTLKNLVTARKLGMRTIYIGDALLDSDHPADYVTPDVLAALRIVLDLPS